MLNVPQSAITELESKPNHLTLQSIILSTTLDEGALDLVKCEYLGTLIRICRGQQFLCVRKNQVMHYVMNFCSHISFKLFDHARSATEGRKKIFMSLRRYF